MAEGGGVLTLVDLAAARQDAVKRAALIAVDIGAALTLLHVIPKSRDKADEDAALSAARKKVSSLAERLAFDYGVTVSVHVTAGRRVREVVEHSRGARLLVLPSRRSNTLGEYLFGNPIQKMVRRVAVPTLVVKGPAAQRSFSRVLVPVHLTVQSMQAVATASQIAPSATLHVLHVVSTKQDGIDHVPQLPGQQTQRTKEQAAEFIKAVIARLLETSGSKRPAFPLAAFGDGTVATFHKAASVGADLIAIGKPRQKLLARFRLGRFTQQVLAESHADVLVVPVPVAGEPVLPLRHIAAEGV